MLLAGAPARRDAPRGAGARVRHCVAASRLRGKPRGSREHFGALRATSHPAEPLAVSLQ